ncbi:hypothetical protein Btru_072100 [Bulinus truncatus]|nr:hypothetical protein Btru_072100 [Bulinus truncatus]
MTNPESGMDLDGESSDMNSLQSTINDITVSTTSSSDSNVEDHLDNSYMIHGQSARNSRDSGIASGKDRNSLKSKDNGMANGTANNLNLPQEISDTTTKTQEWVRTSDFDVDVRTLDGKTWQIHVDNLDEDVESFKKKVEAKTNIPWNQQSLIIAKGKKMLDGQKLGMCNLNPKSVVYCQLRNRGGH